MSPANWLSTKSRRFAEFHASRWWNHSVVLAYMLLCTGVAIAVYQNRQLAGKGADGHKAICVLVNRKIRDVAKSKEFLKMHPHGVDGISAALIQSGIQDDEQDIHSLAVAKC